MEIEEVVDRGPVLDDMGAFFHNAGFAQLEKLRIEIGRARQVENLGQGNIRKAFQGIHAGHPLASRFRVPELAAASMRQDTVAEIAHSCPKANAEKDPWRRGRR